MADSDFVSSASPATAAFVGVVGGAGATRLTVEAGVALASSGASVAVLDASLDTQGLSRHLPGTLDPEFASVLAGDAALTDALVSHPASDGLSGRLELAPVRAPFTRVAAAKTPAAGERVADALDDAKESFDFVLVDAPPVATNPAVGAVTATEKTVLVAPDTERGADGVARERERLSDMGADGSTVAYNRADDKEDTEAHRIPAFSEAVAAGESAYATEATPFAPALAALLADVFGVELDGVPEGGLLSR